MKKRIDRKRGFANWRELKEAVGDAWDDAEIMVVDSRYESPQRIRRISLNESEDGRLVVLMHQGVLGAEK